MKYSADYDPKAFQEMQEKIRKSYEKAKKNKNLDYIPDPESWVYKRIGTGG